MWEQHESFKNNLLEWWNIVVKGTTMYRVSQKLKNIKKELKNWNREVFKSVQKRKDQIKEELESLE